MTDPKQQVTTYTYHLDGSIASVGYTNAQIPTPGVTWTYDPTCPRVATMVDGTGTTSYTYHPAGQLGAGQVATVDGPLTSDVVSYTYDPLGRVVTRGINGVALTLAYDALGRVEREVNVLGTFDDTYDSVSRRLATVTSPNTQTSTYGYFPAVQEHRLQTIHHQYPNGSTLSKFDYTYDAVGNIVTWRQQADATAVLWEYGYDPANQLVRAVKKADPQGTILQRFAYGYDPAGNRLFEQIDDTVTAWTYDRLNRLVTQQAGGWLRVAGSVNEPATVRVQGQPAVVDSAGVFVGGVQVAPGTTRFTVTATDASGNTATQRYDVDQTGPAKTFTFDANGNLTSDGTQVTDWDAANRLVGITQGASRSEFSFDGLNRRSREVRLLSGVAVEQTQMIWCELRVCETRAVGTGATRREFVDGYWKDGVARFYARDQLGSVTEVVESNSTVQARYRYDPFGRQVVVDGSEINAIGWTGLTALDSAGVALAPLRAYDPDLARWLSEDPAGTVDGPNRYTYVGSNPVRFVDPLGLQAEPAPVPSPRPVPRPAPRVLPFPTPEAPSPVIGPASVIAALLMDLLNATPAGEGSDLQVPPGEVPDIGPQRCRPYKKTNKGCTCFVACDVEVIITSKNIPKIFPKRANGVGTGNNCGEAKKNAELEAKAHFAAFTGGREIGLKTKHCKALWCKDH